MRLRRLDLTRYGRFTDHSVDFGPGGGVDMHVVYGPNEAGKSTLFNAILDLLYGIPGQSPYGFKHSYATMRVGAVLEGGGAAREVVRVKRQANTLLDPEGTPLPEAAVAAGLGGVGREAYRNMFSLDEESLENGGKAILESRGDLGSILFSATAGLAGLTAKLDGVRNKADEFHRKKAHDGTLIRLKRRLEELRAELRSIDVNATRYAELVARRDQARRDYEEAAKALGAVQARLDAITVELAAAPRLVDLRGRRDMLAPLLDLPEPPGGWHAELPDLVLREAGAAGEARSLERDVADLEEALAVMALDEAALAAERRSATLRALRPRKETAVKDLPARRAKLVEEDALIAASMARLGRAPGEDADVVALPLETATALAEAIKAWSGVETATATARDALSTAELKLREARARLAERLAAPADVVARDRGLADLAATLAACRRDDHRPRIRSTRLDLEEAEAVLAAKLATLAPAAGGISDVAARMVPDPRTLAAWAETSGRLAREALRLDGERHSLDVAIAGSDAELRALTASGAIPSDAEAGAARAARDLAWSRHLGSLDRGTAGAFETALRTDDQIGERRFREASRVAAMRQLEAASAGARARREVVAAESERALAARAALDEEVSQAWIAATGAAGGPRPGVAELEAWLARRADALTAAATASRAARGHAGALADGAALASRLARALADVEAGAGSDDLDVLFQRAQSLLDSAATERTLHAAAREREAEVGDRRASLADVELRARAWSAAWTEACSSCWLGACGRIPSVALVDAALKELAVLAPAQERRVGLADRVAKMEADVAAHAAEVRALAALIGEPDAADAVLAERVVARIDAAVSLRGKRGDAESALRERRARRAALEDDRAAIAARAGEMAEFFGVAGSDAVAIKLSGVAARARLRGEVAEIEREIVGTMGTRSIHEAEGVLDAADREALTRERAEAKARVADLDQRCRELFAAMGVAEDAVAQVGGDARAATLEEKRRTTLLEIEDGARRHLRARTGVAALEQALRLYRERHRGSMLERASEAFRTISEGAYVGLRTQPHKEREILLAMPAEGGSKAASELSKGARFQLYLALRVAGYLEHALIGPPPPFVADDIMETFDDFRAEEAFRLFLRMTEVGQVVYLTHHKHLLPIAREVCPDVRIHMLGPSTRAA